MFQSKILTKHLPVRNMCSTNLVVINVVDRTIGRKETKNRFGFGSHRSVGRAPRIRVGSVGPRDKSFVSSPVGPRTILSTKHSRKRQDLGLRSDRGVPSLFFPVGTNMSVFPNVYVPSSLVLTFCGLLRLQLLWG